MGPNLIEIELALYPTMYIVQVDLRFVRVGLPPYQTAVQCIYVPLIFGRLVHRKFKRDKTFDMHVFQSKLLSSC